MPVALFFLLIGAAARAVESQNEGDVPRGNCSGVPSATLVKLDWRGQNLVGCKIELLSTGSRIHRIASDCTTGFYADLPSYIPREWTILSQPPGANAQITPVGNGATATLSLPVAGEYTVQFTVCPSADCLVFEFPGSSSTFPLTRSSGTITLRTESELPLRVQERPVLPPSAMVPTPRLDLSDEERSCRCQGGGGFLNPQWVTVDPWNNAENYRLLEGYVVRSWPPLTDAPFNHDLAFSGANWYVIHDVNVVVSPDPRYYHLLSTKPEYESNPHLLGCEAQGDRVPERFRPVEGDRVSLFGFWILDCGHEPFYTEIHPIVGWAVHKNRPVRIPDNAQFTFDLVTNTVNSTAGTGLYVPGIVTDLWFISEAGEATGGDDSSLAQPAQRGQPPLPPFCFGDDNITRSPIRRQYEFNIYLPKNPSQVFAEAGQVRPRAPLHVKISNPHGSPGPDPTFTRITETNQGVIYEYLRVRLDLLDHTAITYSRRIEAAWVYPMADNWGLAEYRVMLHRLDVFNDLDSKLRWPGTDGDWILWMMLPSVEQPWTRIMDGFNNSHGAEVFDPPWSTGSSDPVFRRPPLSLDPQHRLGPDILSFSPYINFWMGGYEADEGYDDDPGRISGFVFNPGTFETWLSHNGNFSATLTLQRRATLNTGALSPAAAALGRHYLLTCTNKINNRSPVRDMIAPLDLKSTLAEGVSGEPPWSPVDPQNLYGSGGALLGDVNGDGFPDVVLGAKNTNSEVHLFLGGRNGFPPAPHTMLVGLPGTSDSSRDPAPIALAGASDCNDDGIPDLIIGAPTYASGGSLHGAVFAFSGTQLAAGGTLHHSNAIWSVIGGFPNAQLGYSIAAGDINRDGLSDVVIGAPFYENSVLFNRPVGRVFVYLNTPTGLPAVQSQTLIPQTIIGSEHWFGFSVSMAGDLNKDGYTDVVIGAPHYSNPEPNEGAFFTYYGSPTGLVLNTSVLFEGGDLAGQLGYAVAGAGDMDGDGYADVMVSAPYYSGSEFTLENGRVDVFRGSIEGIAGRLWSAFGDAGGAHFGLSLGPVGDMNADGLADVAVGAPGEVNPEGLRGRVSYFLGARALGASRIETWRTWGVSRVASLMINSPCCVPFISPCCNTGSTNKVDFNIDGFADALVFDSTGGGEPFTRVQLVLGGSQRAIVPANERFYRAGAGEPFTFPNIFTANFLADMVRSGQTNRAKFEAMLANVRDLYFRVQQAGGQPGDIVPMLQHLQQVVPADLFKQYLGDVDLELGTAFYIDCGATNEYTDALGRQWLPDAPFLVNSANPATFAIGFITNTLTGDPYLPNAMLNSERWFDGHIRYQVSVPNGWYTVLLYFSENYAPAASPSLGGTGCATCARIFDLEVEGQRLSAYNQADAALPPDGDGLGRLYTATQVRFNVEVTDALLDIAVLDRGAGNPPENAAIKGIAILGRPAPGHTPARPRVDRLVNSDGSFRLYVDPQANLARFLAGEVPIRLQTSTNLTAWQSIPNLPVVGTVETGLRALFALPQPTNATAFYRAVVTLP